MEDLICPHCDHPQDIFDDGEHFNTDTPHRHECEKCGKIFIYYTEVSYSFEARAAECLNDGKHEWQPTQTYLKFAVQMCCKFCHEERQPTPDPLKPPRPFKVGDKVVDVPSGLIGTVVRAVENKRWPLTVALEARGMIIELWFTAKGWGEIEHDGDETKRHIKHL